MTERNIIVRNDFKKHREKCLIIDCNSEDLEASLTVAKDNFKSDFVAFLHLVNDKDECFFSLDEEGVTELIDTLIALVGDYRSTKE